jgi:hypothetical protein
MAIECTSKTMMPKCSLFKECGGTGSNIQEVETGWWIGTYDKTQGLYKEEKGY